MPIELVFDGALDPLSVGPGAIEVTRPDGSPWPARLEPAGRVVVVRLELSGPVAGAAPRPAVTPAEAVASPSGTWPAAVRLVLAADPSPSALRCLDGRRLARRTERSVALGDRLAASGRVPRLVEVDGRAPPGDGVLSVGPTLKLVFDGAIDPASASPAACPLVPLQGGLPLGAPLWPGVRWRCTGQRFELQLTLPVGHGPLQLGLRRFALRDPAGRAPEPPLVLELRAS